MMNELSNQDQWCDFLLFILVHFVWQGFLAVLLTGAAVKCLRQSSSRVRYRVYFLGLLLTTACPIITASFFSRSGLSVVAPMQSDSRVASSAPPAATAAGDEVFPSKLGGELPDVHAFASRDENVDEAADPFLPAIEQAAEPGMAMGDLRKWNRTLRFWVAGFYLLGVICMMLRLLVSLASARNLQKTMRLIDDSDILDQVAKQAERLRLRAAPLVRLSQAVVVPTIVGIFRPIILLPAALVTALTPSQLASVIAHELAHIRRLDPLINFLQRMIEVVFFFHPAVWLLSRWLTRERELACDEMVVSAGQPALSYAEALLRVAELGCGQKGSPRFDQLLTLNAVRGSSTLDLRVRTLLDAPVTEQFRVGQISVVKAVLCLSMATAAACMWAGLASQQSTADRVAGADSGSPGSSANAGHNHLELAVTSPPPARSGGWQRSGDKQSATDDAKIDLPPGLTPRETVNGFLDRIKEGKKTINGINGSWDHAWAYTTRENGFGIEMQQTAKRPAFRAAAHLESENRAMVLTSPARQSDSAAAAKIGVFDLVRREEGWLIQNMELYKPESAWLIADGFSRHDGVRWGILSDDLVGAFHSGTFVVTEHQFDADGTYRSKSQNEASVSGTWRLDGDVLIRSFDDKEFSNRIVRLFEKGFVIAYGKRNRTGFYRVPEKNKNAQEIDDSNRPGL
ncbi:MAG: M56 family metallopeptidase [Pirellulales bacterium]|nr:M56 family metallopeptidase [Pirellulales bacterium]